MLTTGNVKMVLRGETELSYSLFKLNIVAFEDSE